MQVRDARMEDATGLARVQVDSYRSAYAGIWPEAALGRLSYEEQEQDWRDWIRSKPDDVLCVAEPISGEIVGYALGRPGTSGVPGYDSELMALHVLGAYQRQGLGRRLLAVVAERLWHRGSESLMLWVMEENRARGFHERLGGQLLDETKMSWVEKPEVAYGWPAIEVLCAGAREAHE